MSTLQITASLSGGTLTVSGSGWPAGGTVTIQMTDATGFSESPQCTADGGGSFTYTAADPCQAAGEFKIAATNGLPQPGAEYNYEWSDIVTLTCTAPAQGAGAGHQDDDSGDGSDPGRVTDPGYAPSGDGDDGSADQSSW